jgi:hypothetical protein
MIITDIRGGKLKLTSTTLTELTGEVVPGDKWTLDLSELTKAGATDRVTELFLHRIDRTYGKITGKITGACTADASHLRIGCRVFTIRTFGRIVRAALDLKEKGTRKRK